MNKTAVTQSITAKLSITQRFYNISKNIITDNLIISEGTKSDYLQLAQHHYKSHHPPPVTSIISIHENRQTVVGRYFHTGAQRVLIGVLLRSLPRLQCKLRAIATHNRYAGLNGNYLAGILSKEIRTISRVVIDPRYRGLGIAVRLVKYALQNPQTIYTEALAAMGRVNPFFEHAGMTRYDRPPHPQHIRLLAAFTELGLKPWWLASNNAVWQWFNSLSDSQQSWIQNELSRWAGAAFHMAKNKKALMTFDDYIKLARDKLVTNPVYYFYKTTDDSLIKK